MELFMDWKLQTEWYVLSCTRKISPWKIVPQKIPPEPNPNPNPAGNFWGTVFRLAYSVPQMSSYV